MSSGDAAIITTRGGRRVVLKRLDDDCLLDGQLHPSIKLRLERVRELPVRPIANFLGVERGGDDGVARMIWEHVPGTPLAELQSADWLRVCREVVLAVQSLHAAGIVHGAIHAGNVIVDDATGEVRLTHVSPLLYTEVENDAADVTAMLADLVHAREPGSPLAASLAAAQAERWSLDQLYRALAETPPRSAADAVQGRDSGRRGRLIVFAMLIALVGAATALAVYWRVTSSESQPYAPPVARNE